MSRVGSTLRRKITTLRTTWKEDGLRGVLVKSRASLSTSLGQLDTGVARSGGRAIARWQRQATDDAVPLLSDVGSFAFGGRRFKAGRETILVVSHEASRTGAPVLSLNLVQAFGKRYNVVVLLVGGGSLSDAFRRASVAVVAAPGIRWDPVAAHSTVGRMCERYHFKFAVVNCIESRAVLPSLADRLVPAISLIHEYAAYTRPREAFREAFFWSGEVVFSADVTLQNAFAEYPDLPDRATHVLPQGRCLVPLGGLSDGQLEDERARIRRLIRPRTAGESGIVIIGAGSVNLRKGVDLFVELAARVVRTPEGAGCRFVWIGDGYDPENNEYSAYLADQIRRAGLSAHVSLIGETPAIDTAYEEADLLLLSSRLDPLPNVAIDAMTHGMPVLCFNGTTGIADFLGASGLADTCVAEFLDSADMTAKILALAGSKSLRQKVGSQCRKASVAYFSMSEYVNRLDALAQNACNRSKQEKTDTQTILGSGLFRRVFACPPDEQGLSLEAEVRRYVRAWASGVDRRKPFPGFHPGIYLERHGLASPGTDPFADYLHAGRPAGPWNYPVIFGGTTGSTEVPSDHRVALHLHVRDAQAVPEVLVRLSRNRIRPDLLISVNSEAVGSATAAALKTYGGRVVAIRLVPDRGRHIGPLFTAFGHTLLQRYEFVCHMHTRLGADSKSEREGSRTSRWLLANLLGESSGMADVILTAMAADTSIGMVFPDDPHVVGWHAQRINAEPLSSRFSLHDLPDHSVFPCGGMFWARVAALSPWLDLGLTWNDYPDEPLPHDGTSIQEIDRLLTSSSSENSWTCATTYIAGLTR
jgi:glycosyltransferase involved in cell wall biosynthesis